MIPDQTWLIAGARMFALGAHIAVGQQRKYTGEPYWHHLAEVADLVSRHTDNSPTQVAAAWLHDVLEDTAVSACDIERLFGPEVAGLVVGLTDVSTPADGILACPDVAGTLQATCFACPIDRGKQ